MGDEKIVPGGISTLPPPRLTNDAAHRPIAPSARRSGIGLLTPSANVVVEAVAIRLTRLFPDVSVHFSRYPLSGTDPNPDDYDWDAMMSAARLLADAEPGVLIWAGSKGVSAGVARDRLLCQRIADAFGIPATTPTLALYALARRTGMRRVALISPYTAGYQAGVIRGLEKLNLACVAEAHSGLSDNLSYARVSPDAILDMARTVAASRPDAILAWCTNLNAAPLAATIEDEFGIPFYDATAIGLWDALGMLGFDRSQAAAAWGGVFNDAGQA